MKNYIQNKTLKNSILLLVIFSFFSSCHYKPILGYIFNEKGFKKFSKQEKIAGDNSNPQRDYHINKYDWNLKIIPEKKAINSVMHIYFTTKSKQKVFLFDLQNRMKIKAYSCNIKNAKIVRKRDLMYLEFDKEVKANTQLKLSISYEGKPINYFGMGTVIWRKDKKGRDWISSVTEGIGPQYIFPCNALLREEADTTNINITVPNNLTAVCNGKLKQEFYNKQENTKTFQFEVNKPINTYGISFNVGNFVKLTKPYTDINGIERDIEFQVLDYDKDTASVFYEQTAKILNVFENLYGIFPFWDDGCKFVQSAIPYSSMEHQSAISMGIEYKQDWKEYNTTVVHELSHEWWGNSITGKDYCDIWIHEGIATYSEALFVEQVYGKQDYEKAIRRFTYGVYNKIPIYKKCDVLYSSWFSAADMDIYTKGALMMHSLRKVVDNDSLFFYSLRAIYNDLALQHVSTEEFISKFNKLLGNDYSSLFNMYLYETKPPILDVIVNKKKKEIKYKWKTEIPFYQKGKIYLKDVEEIIELEPTNTFKIYNYKDSKKPKVLFEKSIYYILDITYEKTKK